MKAVPIDDNAFLMIANVEVYGIERYETTVLSKLKWQRRTEPQNPA